jgi:putative ABC transport system permease protein
VEECEDHFNMLQIFTTSVRMAMESLLANKVRAMLTMLGIIIGVGAVITMTAIGQGAKKAVSDQITSMGTNVLTIYPGAASAGGASFGAGSSNKLTDVDAKAIKRSTYLSAVAPIVTTQVQAIAGNLNWSTRITGTTPEYLAVRNWRLTSGGVFTESDVRAGSKVCLLGASVAKNLFPDGGDPVGTTIRIKKLPFTIIGILEEKGTNSFGTDQDDIILAPVTTVMKKITGTTFINVIIASAISPEAASPATENITEIIRASHRLTPTEDNDFQVRSQTELAATAEENSNTLTSLLRNAAIISLLVGGIGIMNIMLVTVTERTREIGIRKSLGAKRSNILMQFLVEAMVLSLVGGILGVSLGYGASAFISANNGWTLFISPLATALSFAAAAAVGIFFGFYPAQKAARLDPIESLRYE